MLNKDDLIIPVNEYVSAATINLDCIDTFVYEGLSRGNPEFGRSRRIEKVIRCGAIIWMIEKLKRQFQIG